MVSKSKLIELSNIKLSNQLLERSIELKEKDREITASLNYAQTIQRAILPHILQDTFVLYMPKDIVSGDFYWMHEINGKKIIACVDCTGHGVPGAFMSIIGYTSLNKIILQEYTIDPGTILNKLTFEVCSFLQHGLDDGMDISLIIFDKEKLNYAAGIQTIYLVRNGDVITLKGERISIGLTFCQLGKTFSSFSYNIQPNDMIYLTSDGYGDQFGSEKCKKFQSSNIKRILSEIWNLPLDEQKNILENEIREWQGDEPQTDDIMFIATKI